MHVIGGSAKGKKLLTPKGSQTRPILSRVRTALFDIIRKDLKDKIFLDLFAGSGSIGIEALSQGAEFCYFTDSNLEATKIIKKNLLNTNLDQKARVVKTDAFLFLKTCKKSFDIIYIAPPQYKNIWQEVMFLIAEHPELLNTGAQIIIQIDPKEYEELSLNCLKENKQKLYGNSLLVFYTLHP